LEDQPAEFEGKQIRRIEKEVLVLLRNKLDTDLRYETSNGLVFQIDISSSPKPAAVLEECLQYLKLFRGLKELRCHNTSLTALPETLPDSLQGLWCFNTQITTLPETLPDSLQRLDCSNTQLTALPELPDRLHELYCSNTPVAKNPATKNQLEEFKKNHPLFQYRISQF